MKIPPMSVPGVHALVMAVSLSAACDRSAEAESGQAAAGGSAYMGAVADTLFPQWELSESPVFSVSHGDSSGGGLPFRGARGGLNVAAILPGEVVAVGNAEQIVLLDERGQATRIVGRAGEGPGEFRHVSGLFTTESGFAVWDIGLRRVSSWSEAGEHLASFGLHERASPPVGRLGGAGIVARSGFVGDRQEPRSYLVHDARGVVTEEVVGLVESMPTASWTGVTVAIPCYGRILEAVVDSTLYLIDSSSGQITAVGVSGARQLIYQSASPPLITPGARDWVRGSLDGRGAPTRVASRALRHFGQVGEQLPAFWDDVIADPDGRLLLRRATCGRGDGDERAVDEWEVIDTRGAFLGLLRSHRMLLAARGDQVVAGFDSVGVPYVELYQLRVAQRGIGGEP